ncbi:MAG: hypothetical protein LBD56_00895, partial [Endomicrobium sp.]|nr:hypothetical protein [Endomicrobium sp.]
MAKQDALARQEQISSWTVVIEVLEKAYGYFYSYKDFALRKFSPKLVWECKWDYKDEDKKYCRNEVVKILK